MDIRGVENGSNGPRIGTVEDGGELERGLLEESSETDSLCNTTSVGRDQLRTR